MKRKSIQDSKSIKAIIKILRIVQGNEFIKWAILDFQVLFLAVRVLMGNFQSFFKNNAGIIDIFEALVSKNQFMFTTFWIISCFLFILIILVIVCRNLKKEKKFLLQITAVLYITIQLFLMPYSWAIFKICLSGNDTVYIIISLASLLIILFITYLASSAQIYGILTIPTIACCYLFDENEWKFILFALGCYYISQQASKFKKLVYAMLNSLIVWSLVYLRNSQSESMEFVFLLTLEMIVSGAIYFLPIHVSSQMADQYIINSAKKIQKNSNKQTLSNEELMQLKFLIEQIKDMNAHKSKKQLKQMVADLQDNEINRQSLLNFLQLKLTLNQQNKLLLVEVKLQIGKDLAGTLDILSGIVPKNIIQRVKLQKLKQRAQQVFFEQLNSKVNIANIQKVNEYLELFYLSIDIMTERLKQYWVYLSLPKVNEQKINTILQRVLQSQTQAYKYLTRMTKYKKCIQQKKIYQNISKFIDFYQDNPVQQINQEAHTLSQKVIDYEYFIIKNQNIEEISKKLLIELTNAESLMKGNHFTGLFPIQIHYLIYQIIRDHQPRTIIIPLLAQNKIIVKKVNISLIPSFSEGSSYLFLVEDINEDPSVLYDAANDMTLYFSSSFYKEYKIQQTHRFAEANPISSQIFKVDLTSNNFLQQIRAGKHFNTTFDWYQAVQSRLPVQTKKTKQKSNIKINIKLINQYEHGFNNLLLLSLNKGHFIRSQVVTDQVKLFSEIPHDPTHQRDQVEEYSKQQYFCKIVNPFQSTVLQKLQTLKISHRFNHVYKIGAAFILIVILKIICLSLIISFSMNRQSSYSNLLQEGHNLNTDYGNIISQFYYSYINYYLKYYPSQITKWNPNLNITQLQQQYSRKIFKLCQQTEIEQISNPYQKSKAYKQYTLNYQFFNIAVDTTGFDMINLFTQVLKAVDTSNLTFLLQNYQQVRRIQPCYDVSSIFSNLLPALMQPSLLIKYISIPIMVVLVLIIYYFLFQIHETISKIYLLLSKVTKGQAQQIISKISNIKGEIKILSHIQKTKFTTSQALNSQTKEQHQIQNRFDQIKKTSLVVKNWIFIYLIVSLVCCLIVLQIQITSEKSNFQEIFQYMSQIHLSLNLIVTEISDAFNAAVWKDVFHTIDIFGKTNNITIFTYFDKESLPSYFYPYQLTQRQTIVSDLCRFSNINNIQYFQGVSCDLVFSGALSKGYSIIYQLYRESLTTLRNTDLSNFFEVRRAGAVYPILIQSIYTKTIIMSTITNLSNLYVTTSINYSEYILANIETTVYFIGLYEVLIVAWSIFWIRKLMAQCKRALRGLRSIPKQTLLNIRTSREMVKSNFLLLLDRI